MFYVRDLDGPGGCVFLGISPEASGNRCVEAPLFAWGRRPCHQQDHRHPHTQGLGCEHPLPPSSVLPCPAARHPSRSRGRVARHPLHKRNASRCSPAARPAPAAGGSWLRWLSGRSRVAATRSVPTCGALLRPDMALCGLGMTSMNARSPELSRAGVSCILLSHQYREKFGRSNFSGAPSV
jgi:hypothetical protein